MEKKIDDKINELFKVLQKQKEDVAKVEKSAKKSWITNCTFRHNGDQVNIQTAQLDSIHKLATTLLMIQEFSDKAADKLKISPSKEFAGYTYDDWFADFEKRIAILSLNAKKAKLAELEKRLDGIVSPEQRRQKELEAITSELDLDE